MNKNLKSFVGNLLNNIKLSNGSQARPSGLFHYKRARTGEQSIIHLRIDPDGSGILIVNANRIMHLNHTAALMAYHFLEETPESAVIREITQNFNVSDEQALKDYSETGEKIKELTRPDCACPVHDLELDVKTPFSAKPAAPYRMDLAITYRCNNDCTHCYNARSRDFNGISTDEWKKVLDKLWRIGIPHIVFTGGEPTLHPDLPELISHAQKNGQITGLNTNARRLSEKKYVEKLVASGLDHVQITVESHDRSIHDAMVNCKGAWDQTIKGLENALDTPLFVMTNTTMLRDNASLMDQTLDFLSSLSVPTVGLNALIYSGKGKTVGTGLSEDELLPLLEMAQQHTSDHNQRLIWYTPTQYCNFDPMQLELGVKGCTAALYNMCIEPDGGVIPCQSYYSQIGNIQTDSWDSIWNHDLSINLRERKYIPSKCTECILLQECGGGCPLILENSQTLINPV